MPPEPDGWRPPDTLANRLALVHHCLGLSSRKVQERTGINRSTWQAWLAGTHQPPHVGAMMRVVADEFGVDYGWLVGGGPLASPGEDVSSEAG